MLTDRYFLDEKDCEKNNMSNIYAVALYILFGTKVNLLFAGSPPFFYASRVSSQEVFSGQVESSNASRMHWQ